MSAFNFECTAIDDPELLGHIAAGCELALTQLSTTTTNNNTTANSRPVDSMSTADIMSTIDRAVTFHRTAIPPLTPDQAEELAFNLGCLWGEQLVQELGWKWFKVQPPGAGFLVAVAPTDLSLVVYPFLFLVQCLEGQQPVTLLKSFEVLTTPGRVPDLPARGLENLMDHI